MQDRQKYVLNMVYLTVYERGYICVNKGYYSFHLKMCFYFDILCQKF